MVVTNESGLYRAPLLSLGTYRVAAELQGFKKFEQTGVSLRAGQTAVIDVGADASARSPKRSRSPPIRRSSTSPRSSRAAR